MLAFVISMLLAGSPILPPPPLAPELVPPETDISITLVLKLAEDRLKADAKAGRLPKDVSPGAVSEKYGVSPEVFNRLKQWLAAAGLEVAEAQGSGRLMVPAHGSAAQVNKLFGIHLHRVKGHPVDIHAPDVKPKLPEWVQQSVKSVAGLDTRPVQVKVPNKYKAR